MASLAPQTHPAANARFADMRAAPRFNLVIRSAKLACASGEFLCVLRDVSETGVRLRLFHPLPDDDILSLELAAGDCHAVLPVWERDDHAGFRFVDPVNVERFMAEAGPFAKRPIRLALALPARLQTSDALAPAVVRNLSQAGAGIETEAALAIGERVRLRIDGQDDLVGHVCWRACPAYGLALTRTIGFEDLAEMAWHRRRTSPAPGRIMPAPGALVPPPLAIAR